MINEQGRHIWRPIVTALSVILQCTTFAGSPREATAAAAVAAAVALIAFARENKPEFDLPQPGLLRLIPVSNPDQFGITSKGNFSFCFLPGSSISKGSASRWACRFNDRLFL
jgi:hypothetical protein